MLEIRKNDLRDQIATDHEEDIDTNKPTAKSVITSMKKYYRKHSKGSQPVNLSPVFHLPESVLSSARTRSASPSA